MKSYTLHHGNNLDILPTIPDASVDAIVTDPPYELGFMGKKWDASGIAYNVDLWAECLRVLKPGGHLLAFGGTRTYHRMTVAIEDAGFEIRDSLHWIYGSGFPKSHNLQGEWEGWGTALKPGHEPIVLARKPLTGTVAANVLQHGTGALNINACRIANTGAPIGRVTGKGTLSGTSDGYDRPWKNDPKAVAARQERADIAIDKANNIGRWPANVMFDTDAATELGPEARYFYVAKPSRAERNAGLDELPEAMPLASNGSPNAIGITRGSRSQPRANFHPTVKPITLMRYLIRLVTPPDGTILDPFAGSGTTLAAAILEGHHPIGIELTDDYLPIIHARCQWAADQVPTHTQEELPL